MIQNIDKFNLCRAALRDLEDALMALQARLGQTNPELYAVMAETYHKDINRIRSEIDTYDLVSGKAHGGESSSRL